MSRKLNNALSLLLVAAWPALAQFGNSIPAGQPVPQLQNVSIKQKLGSQVPLDLHFRDENGRTVQLQEYFGKKPVVLALGYFQCPQLCPMVFGGLVRTLKVVKYNIGPDYEVLTVSFDPREKPPLAKERQEQYLKQYGRPGAREGWHFLTGDQKEIVRLTNAVGYGFDYDKQRDQFAHASAIMLLTPQGKVSRYFYGIEYSARDLQMGLAESSHNKIGSPVDQILMYCFHYDPNTGRYSLVILNTVRVFGLITVFGILLLVILLRWRDKRKELRPAMAYPRL